eukprot:7832721-Pyramimonas_sp.AAC.1
MHKAFGENARQHDRAWAHEKALRLRRRNHDEVQSYFDAMERHHIVTHASSITIQRQNPTKWAKQTRSVEPGALHMHVKKKAAPTLELATSCAGQFANPDTVMEGQANSWARAWMVPVDTRGQLAKPLRPLGVEAKQQELPGFTLEEPDAVITERRAGASL